jgi:hypothetical protein
MFWNRPLGQTSQMGVAAYVLDPSLVWAVGARFRDAWSIAQRRLGRVEAHVLYPPWRLAAVPDWPWLSRRDREIAHVLDPVMASWYRCGGFPPPSPCICPVGALSQLVNAWASRLALRSAPWQRVACDASSARPSVARNLLAGVAAETLH